MSMAKSYLCSRISLSSTQPAPAVRHASRILITSRFWCRLCQVEQAKTNPRINFVVSLSHMEGYKEQDKAEQGNKELTKIERGNARDSERAKAKNRETDSIPDNLELRNYNSILSLLTAGKGRQLTNDIVDDLLKSIGPKVKLIGLDPMKLPERSVEFQKQVCCKTYPGVAELKKGVCRGVSDARRHGEIGLNIGENIEITFVVRLGPLSATYDSDVTLRNHLFHPTFTATTECMDVLIDMVLNTKAMTLDMRNLKITEVAPISVKITNMSIFTRFLVKPVVQHMINSEAKLFIAKVNVEFKEAMISLASNALNIKRWLPTLGFGSSS